MDKQKELETLYKQRTKLEDQIYEKGETQNRVVKLLELNIKIQNLEVK